MKNLFLFFALIIFIACQNETKPEVSNQETETVKTTDSLEKMKESEEKEESNSPLKAESVTGIYVGMFVAEKFDEAKKPTWENKINVTIDEVEGGKVIGHSVVAGNARPFEGTINPQESPYGEFKVVAKEPGDDRYDGTFTFTIHQKTRNIKGIWDANDQNLAVTQRSYNLEKTEWKYDSTLELLDLDYVDLYNTFNNETGESEFLTEDIGNRNPSLEKLTKEDVENLHKGDLEVMRNSIYARHGYSFKNRKMRYVFNYVDWYIPMHTDIRENLTTLEKENIALIKRYEQHAERYYDSFGR